MLLKTVISEYFPPTGDLPVSEDSDVSNHHRGNERSSVPAGVMGDANSDVHHSCPSLQRSCAFTTFKPTTSAIATSPDSPESREVATAGPIALQKVTCGWQGNKAKSTQGYCKYWNLIVVTKKKKKKGQKHTRLSNRLLHDVCVDISWLFFPINHYRSVLSWTLT